MKPKKKGLGPTDKIFSKKISTMGTWIGISLLLLVFVYLTSIS